jgi:hypothetical protein
MVLSPTGDDEAIHPDRPIRTSRVAPHDDLVSGVVDHHARRTCFVRLACPQTCWTPLASPFLGIYSNACSSRDRRSGGAPFQGATEHTALASVFMRVLLGLWRRLSGVSGQLCHARRGCLDAEGWGMGVGCLVGRAGSAWWWDGWHGVLAQLLLGGRQCGVAWVISAAAGPAAG